MIHKIIRYTLLAIILFSTINYSQQMKMISGGDVAFVAELKSIVEYSDNKLKISLISNTPSKSKTDIQNDDEILYVNGKRVKSLKEFNAQYESTKIGEEVKLGIKRKDQMLISSFLKQDPSKFKHKIMRVEEGSPDNTSGKREMKKEQIRKRSKQQKTEKSNTEVQLKTKSSKK